MNYLVKMAAILTVGLLCNACSWFESNPDPLSQLPPETQTGANTFGCLVNGQPFIPKSTVFGVPEVQKFLASTYGGNFSVYGVKATKDEKGGVGFGLANLTKEGIYVIDTRINKYDIIGYNDVFKNCAVFTSDTLFAQQGVVEITKFDKKNFIVSGRFSANLQSKDCGKIVITHGRFDVKF
jgi:hypothetical protein